jgi:hypothetical protein
MIAATLSPFVFEPVDSGQSRKGMRAFPRRAQPRVRHTGELSWNCSEPRLFIGMSQSEIFDLLSIRKVHHPDVADGTPFQKGEVPAVGGRDTPGFKVADLLPQKRGVAVQVDM